MTKIILESRTKKCAKCGIEKTLNEFQKSKITKIGVRAQCKACISDQNKAYRMLHREKLNANKRIWDKANKDHVSAYSATYRQLHKDKYRSYNKKYNKVNEEKLRKAAREYYTTHKKEFNTRAMRRRKIDPKFKLNRSMSTAIRQSLRNGKGNRPWLGLVSYTLEQLRTHLEKQFTEGMTWKNYGSWHVDHKIPLSVFNFTKPEHTDFQKAWRLKNLQPLWAKDNMKKHAKLTKHFQPSLLL